MARSIALPDSVRPSNLHLRESVRIRHIDSDLFDVCKRVGEISERLYIVELSEGQEYAFVVMERCEDNVDRRVFKVAELDGRVLDKLRYLMARPLPERLAEIERMEGKFEADRREEEVEGLYERLGAPMLPLLDRLGFLGAPRGTSYPKLGVAAPGRAR